MALSRAAYRNFTASDIDGRISNTCTHSVNGSNVDCTDITVSKVRTVLGSSAYNLSSLCTATGVNHWSAWGPTTRAFSGGVLTNSDPSSSYSLGSFAGYHHDAITPVYESGGSNTYSYKQSGSDMTFTCVLDIGEIRYDEITNCPHGPVTHFAFSVWDGATCKDGKVIAIADAVDGTGHSSSRMDFSQAGTRITVSGITSTTTYTCKIWLCSNSSWDYTGTYKEGTMTPFADWTVQVRIASANHHYVNAPYNDSTATCADGATLTSGDWTYTAPVFTESTGQLSMTNLCIGGSSYGAHHTHVNAYCESGYYSGTTWVAVDTYTASTNFFDDTLGPPTDCLDGPYSGIQAYPSSGGAVPTLSGLGDNTYGYRVVINVNPTA